jgi:gluconate kinase
MFIVIEGTDASGKTSLIEAVTNEVKTRFNERVMEFHKGRPDEETRRWVLQEYVTSLEGIDWSRSLAVADRWHWGEATYAPLKRPHTNTDGFGLLGQSGWRWVELFMQSRGMVQFWLYQPLEVIQARLSTRGDDYVNVDELETILDLYTNAAKHSIYVGIQPEADSLSAVPELAKYIVDIAAEHAKGAHDVSAVYPEYIGSPRPTALLVGDERNIVKRYGEETKLPFMPVDGNSGDFLLRALPDDFWKTVGIVNVNDMRGSFLDLWVTLGMPPIIALGRNAARGIEKSGIENDKFITLPHPQWVRRFHHADMLEYGVAIKRNATNPTEGDPWVLQ